MDDMLNAIQKLIEEEVGFPLTKFSLVSDESDPENLQALYPGLLPERAWFVQVAFRALEGTKTAIVFVALKNGEISLPHGLQLHLETFLAANREQAKENASPLTLDYIETLEDIVSDTWRFWRDLVYYLDRNHAQLFVQAKLRPQFQHEITRLYRSFQQINFLSSSDQAIDPFPGGVFNLVERIEKKHEQSEE